MHGDAPLPDHFVNTQTLAPMDHVRMQAAAQKWVDSSISKTINCPEDISFEAFKDVYLAAWDSGCKGCTTYRPNAVTGSVLSCRKPSTPPAGRPARRAEVIYLSEPVGPARSRWRGRPTS
jgi:ribonucleoside-diphosphate reductase alpha chain